MNWTSLVAKALRVVAVGASLLSPGLPISALAQTVTLVSDSSWEVFDSNGQYLGLPQNVCLNKDIVTGLTYPKNCPVGDTPPPTWYGYKGAGWTADLSGLPTGARWIWAKKRDKDSTSPIDSASSPAAFQEFIFKTTFHVCDPGSGPPITGTMSVAVDDYAEVSVNSQPIIGSISTSNSSLNKFSIPTNLLRITTGSPPSIDIRPNHITVKARNGPNPPNCNKYECNPAGVVFAASFENAGGPPCRGFYGKAYYTGEEEKTDECSEGQDGGWYHKCVCGDWQRKENKCVTRPQCIGTSTTSGGQRFNLDAIESQTCPTGQSAYPSSHKCLSSGSWDVPLGACVTPPPRPQCTGTSITSGGRRFDVDAIESQTCPTGQSASPTSHKCLSSGNWDVPLGACVTPPLPFVGIGEKCGTPGATAQCPSGTSCGGRRFGCETNIFGKVKFGGLTTSDSYCDVDETVSLVVGIGEKCGSRTEGAIAHCRFGSTCRLRMTGDTYYCDPNTAPPLPLGAACSGQNCDCASTYCDAGHNTKQTNLCMPRGGKGLPNDPCTDNTQCTSGTCNNLRDVDRRWIPGQCR